MVHYFVPSTSHPEAPETARNARTLMVRAEEAKPARMEEIEDLRVQFDKMGIANGI